MAKERLYHKISYQILEMIDSGIFQPGVRLPGERELGEKFGASRVSIREALIYLEAQGRIEIKMGSGAYVLDDHKQLEGFVDIMLGDGGMGGPEQEEADRQFHTTIAEVTGNTALIFTINNLWNMRSEAMKVQSLYRTVCENDGVSLEKEHRVILDALRTRDPETSRHAMKAHFKRMLRSLLTASEQHAQQELERKVFENRSRFLPDD